MSGRRRFWLVAALAIAGLPAFAQPPQAPPTANAALVNGEPITEMAVQRGLERSPPLGDGIRAEILGFLVDNLLVDQYLRQIKLPVDEKQVEIRVERIHEEIKKDGGTSTR